MPEVAGYSFHKMSPSTDIFNDTSTGGGCKASSHYVPRARTGTSEVKPVNASAINLQEIHDFLIDIARRAGEMMLASVPIVNSVGSKKNCEQLHIKYIFPVPLINNDRSCRLSHRDRQGDRKDDPCSHSQQISQL